MGDFARSAFVFTSTEWLLACLAHTTVLIASTWLLLRVLPLRTATRNVLWKVALFGGIMTATLATIATPAQQHATAEGVHREIRWATAHDAVERPGELLPQVSGVPVAPRWVESGSFVRARVADPTPACRIALAGIAAEGATGLAAVRASCASPALWWPSGLVVLWLAGVVFGIVRQLALRRGLGIVRMSLRAPGARARRLLAEVVEVARAGGQGRVARRRIERSRLFVSSIVGGPCVLPGGILVLSDRCEIELTDPELRATLAHEVAHIARGDVVWSTVGRWVGVLLWMQPLGHLVRARLSSTSEVLCDEWAVEATGNRYGLASSIGRVAEWASSAGTPAWSVAMAGRGRRTLSDRVRRILAPTPGRAEPRWVTPLAVVVLVSPLFWLPMAVPRGPMTDLWVEEVDVVRTGVARLEERKVLVTRAWIESQSAPDLLLRGLTPILAGR